MKVISVYTGKGGIGKTTFAVNLADLLAAFGRDVVLVDTDRQAMASNFLDMRAVPEKQRYTLTHVVRDGVPLLEAMYQVRRRFWIVPSDTNIIKASNHIVVEQAPEILCDRIDDLKAAIPSTPLQPLPWQRQPEIRIRNFKPNAPVNPEEVLVRPTHIDYIIVDHAPNPGPLGDSWLLPTDEIWSPLVLEPMPVQGFAQMRLIVNDLFKRRPGKPPIKIIPFKVDHRRDMTTTYLADLYMLYPEEVTRSVHDDSAIPNAQGEKPPQTVLEYRRGGRAAKELLEIALRVEGYTGHLQKSPICALCAQIYEFAQEQLAVQRKA